MWGTKRKQGKKTDNVHPVHLLISCHASFYFCPAALSLSSPPLPLAAPFHSTSCRDQGSALPFIQPHATCHTATHAHTHIHTPLTRCKRHVTSVLSLVGSSRPRPQPQLFPSTRGEEGEEEEDEEEGEKGIGGRRIV